MFISKETLRAALREVVREVVQDELKAALVRSITVQKGPDKQGDPQQRVETVEVSVLDFLAKYLPDIEGRLLGMQADVDCARNRVAELSGQVQAVGRTLVALEQPMRRVAAFSDACRPALEAVAEPQRAQLPYSAHSPHSPDSKELAHDESHPA
ncbi:hypothetical protein [Desulfocurvibacter africanus]|uniref:Uncharacterized protein n=1 Tax=Desulfocurvibacter africanus subsp. africanus str. Walvis Bay TaxID=690850 RepID=F3YY19_DESAF|nr:hypothetical protein [Desulfocurvibacter africanus]EGJ51795.1 hypothetical protein Desaf_3511 [Desulfocurvibacter africanus subsp. africanus str. Walvis Bay]